MSKRTITENWYKFLKEYEEPPSDYYSDDAGDALATAKALGRIEDLKAQKAAIEAEIEELEQQIAASQKTAFDIERQ